MGRRPSKPSPADASSAPLEASTTSVPAAPPEPAIATPPLPPATAPPVPVTPLLAMPPVPLGADAPPEPPVLAAASALLMAVVVSATAHAVATATTATPVMMMVRIVGFSLVKRLNFGVTGDATQPSGSPFFHDIGRHAVQQHHKDAASLEISELPGTVFFYSGAANSTPRKGRTR